MRLWFKISDKGVGASVLVNQLGEFMSTEGVSKKPTLVNNGYLTIGFGGKNHLAHRLVAKAFIPNPDNLPVVNHKDGDKTNNSVNNLEWCTHSYNRYHAASLGLGNVGERHNRGKFTAWEVLYIRNLEGYKSSGAVAKMFGVCKSSIQRIWKKKCWRNI